MTSGELVTFISTLDTYIYPILLLVIWNFITTKKVKSKVFGDGDDPSEKGLSVTVSNLEDRVTALEYNQSRCDDNNDDD